MSDSFSFLFSFYGLLLGLAIAELASGFSRAWDERRRHHIGLIAPLFAIVLLLDLTTFWVNAWVYRDLQEVCFEMARGAATVALLYYFASTLVFPKQGDHDSLDAHILQHRRMIVGCVIASNLIHVIPEGVAAVMAGETLATMALWLGMNGFYYGLLTLAALAPSRKVVIGTLVIIIAFIIGATVVFT